MGATMAEGNVATVRRLYEAFDAGRLEEAVGLLHEDLVVREPPGAPYGGDHHGVTGFFEAGAALAEFDPTFVVPAEFRDAGDRVLVHMTVRFTSRVTGRSAETEVVELLSFRDGRIVEMNIFYKHPEAVAALAER